jgi:hypothetical protein
MRLTERSHNKRRPRTVRSDEMAAGVAAAPVPVTRGQDGRVQAGESARELGRRGGLARAQRRADALGYASSFGLGRLLVEFKDDDAIAPFAKEGEVWMAEQIVACARDYGGGQLSPACIAIWRMASWQRLYASFLFDAATKSSFAWDVTERDAEQRPKRALPRTDLLLAASRLADASRTNILSATDLAAQEAEARKDRHDPKALPPGFEWVPEDKP